uniref:Uncharacterized protein n=1 Tax=Rhizophora mucronata TaxID=61149 RepID=A0A2P2NFN4_RHIMU
MTNVTRNAQHCGRCLGTDVKHL